MSDTHAVEQTRAAGDESVASVSEAPVAGDVEVSEAEVVEGAPVGGSDVRTSAVEMSAVEMSAVETSAVETSAVERDSDADGEAGDQAGGDAVAESDDADDESDEGDDESEESDEDDESDEGAAGSGRRRQGRSVESLRRLEEEGEVAADYLEELLDIADLDGDIDIDVENGRASVAIVAEAGTERELRRLVGPKGEVLEALQDLSRLAVQARTGERSRLMLDVAGFRAARRRALEEQAARACQEVQRTNQPVRLEPMSAFERKVVHDVVADAGLVSESEGEDPSRRVVVHPVPA